MTKSEYDIGRDVPAPRKRKGKRKWLIVLVAAGLAATTAASEQSLLPDAVVGPLAAVAQALLPALSGS